MQKALVGKETLDLRAFLHLYHRDASGKGKGGWPVTPLCPCCREPVHVYKEDEARGLKKVKDEVTQHTVRRRPGFHHYDHGAKDSCLLSYAHDPRYEALLESNPPDSRLREKNKTVLTEPRMHEALEKVTQFLMRRLTGCEDISPEDREELKKIIKKLYAFPGLSEHPWLSPFLEVLFMGPHQRNFRSGNKYKVVFQGIGNQIFSYTDPDGAAKKISVPAKLRLCFARRKYRGTSEMVPVISGEGPVEFLVSRDFARSIVHPRKGNNGHSSRDVARHMGVPTETRNRPAKPRSRYIAPGQAKLDFGNAA